MLNIFLVMTGGALGSLLRYLLGQASSGLTAQAGWPVGTFVANIIGGLLMGVLMGALLGPQKTFLWGVIDTERARLFLGVGLLGGFTTFSAFSLETVMMLERRDYGLAAVYVILSVGLSVAALMAGLMVVRKWMSA